MGASATAKALQSDPAEHAFSSTAPSESLSEGAPDADLAELVRSLRSLVAESPERQAKIEGLMSAYAQGELDFDAEATASAIIDDALTPAFR